MSATLSDADEHSMDASRTANEFYLFIIFIMLRGSHQEGTAKYHNGQISQISHSELYSVQA